MTFYTFEDASQADANLFRPGDGLHFRSALPLDITAGYIAAAPGAAAKIQLSYGGKTLSFEASSLGDQGDAIDFRNEGLSRGTISLLSPSADSLHIYSFTTKAVWSFDGADTITVAGPGTTGVHAGAGNDHVQIDTVVQPDGSYAKTGFIFVDAEAGDDLVALRFATGAVDVWGGAGADTIQGGAHNDHLYGNAATATAGSLDGADSIAGGEGHDYIQGNAGDDVLLGSTGNDRIYGGAGEDILYGEEGHDYLQGNKGDDLLAGNDGNDTIRGGADNDELSGGAGTDMLFGDGGNDILSGGAGLDALTGGAGADLFRFFFQSDASFDADGSGAATDTILDFVKGEDKILLGFSAAAVITSPVAANFFSNLGAAAAYASQLIAEHGGDHEVVAMHQGNDTLLLFAHDGGNIANSAVRLIGTDYSAVNLSFFD